MTSICAASASAASSSMFTFATVRRSPYSSAIFSYAGPIRRQ